MGLGTILLALPPEPGHILPSLPVARRLASIGYSIVFVTSPEFVVRLRAQGFSTEFYDSEYHVEPMPSPLYWTNASGHLLWEKSIPKNPDRLEKRGKLLERRLCELGLKYDIKAFILDRLFCTAYHVSCESVRQVAPVVLLWTSLPSWIEPVPDCDVLNVVLCPEEFEIPGFRRRHKKMVFAEPSIDVHRHEVQWEWADEGITPLVLCAFGTQTQRHTNFPNIAAAVLGAAERLPSMRFVLAVGSGVNRTSKSGAQLPSNIIVEPFIPQLQLMERASLFVSHGGLGGLKEALFKGVPSLVVPLGYDQPYNAARILHFGLGDAIVNQEVAADTLAERIQCLTTNPSVCERVHNFQRLFEKREKDSRAAVLIDLVARG
jgi:UDP:flavonoid glycosyltransferase YjiC (YdhE family)